MRIAQVSPFLPSRSGGSVVYSTNLALQLQGRGHDVEFYAARTSVEDGAVLKEKLYDKTIGRWTIGCADAIAAVSTFDMHQCRETFDVSPDRLHLIPNAVDVEKFHPPA